MRELPIIFSTPMVRAIQDSKKTMTRRVITPQPADDFHPAKFPNRDAVGWISSLRHEYGHETAHFPRYQVGDHLWVREKLLRIPRVFDGDYHSEAIYAADNLVVHGVNWVWEKDTLPGMFMPKGCARFWLEVTAVKGERLNQISPEDAIAEGAEFMPAAEVRKERLTVPQIVFAGFWDSLNGKTHPWKNNYWVWVYSFRRLQK